jgi:hypothetical protein
MQPGGARGLNLIYGFGAKVFEVTSCCLEGINELAERHGCKSISATECCFCIPDEVGVCGIKECTAGGAGLGYKENPDLHGSIAQTENFKVAIKHSRAALLLDRY